MQAMLRKMEALLAAEPPTTAYNRTAVLAAYQAALDGSNVAASSAFQPPVSSPDEAYLAELQGADGGQPFAAASAAYPVSLPARHPALPVKTKVVDTVWTSIL